MANAYHHAMSSAKKWGGRAEDYLEVHQWLDASKEHFADFRHRALRHHSQGIAWAEEVFGATINVLLESNCINPVPVRWVAEQHIKEDLGRIPTLADWLRCIKPEPWMGATTKLEEEQ